MTADDDQSRFVEAIEICGMSREFVKDNRG